MTKPSRASPATTHSSPTPRHHSCQRPCARCGSPAAQRQHDGENESDQRGIRTQHEHAAGAEHGVSQERNDRRIQAANAGQARGHRVGDADRDEYRSQYQPRYDIMSQPRDLVMAKGMQPRQPPHPAGLIRRCSWAHDATWFQGGRGRGQIIHRIAGSAEAENPARWCRMTARLHLGYRAAAPLAVRRTGE